MPPNSRPARAELVSARASEFFMSHVLIFSECGDRHYRRRQRIEVRSPSGVTLFAEREAEGVISCLRESKLQGRPLDESVEF